MTDVTIVLPAVSQDRISSDLRELTSEIDAIDPELVAHGLLGGSNGYGAEFSNDVFEMHPFWWGDCECGHDSREWDWAESNSHREHCYQEEIVRRGYSPDWDEDYKTRQAKNKSVTDAVCAEMGLDPEFGSAVHCTCDYRDNWAQWVKDNPHPKTCPVVRPNFMHKASGVEISWYKYIGRGMEVPENLSRKEWRVIFNECLDSLA